MNTQDRCLTLGVRIRHFPPNKDQNGFTVAYRENYSDLLEIAIATCNKSDVFTKKQGNEIALSRFENGNTTFIPLNRKMYGVKKSERVAIETLIQQKLSNIFNF